MTRENRVQDNWSLLFAQKLALKNEVPLHVCFCLLPKYMDATIRHYRFMLKGLEELSLELKNLQIPFHLIFCSDNVETVRKFVAKNDIGAVVLDFSPLKISTSWVDQLKESLPDNVPLCQVDGHNIVPCWIASDKLEYGARTIRNKINTKLDEFLTKFPPVIKHPFKSNIKSEEIEWSKLEEKLDVDMKVSPVNWAKPGYKAGMQTLFEFCDKRLKNFATKRNNPLENALSNLSTWFHFGQISIQRCILYVQTFKSKYKDSVSSFCEEAIVRRELADNFCFYNKNYDNLDGAYDWAKKTLNDHKKDKRTWLYTDQELEEAKTHDDLWNSAQIQLNTEGKMHGFLRMYWAKKILEWTQSPEDALRVALYLNDKYSLDGRDPNGFVGCMWSICGIHDQGWREREIFGKIRYMNYQGCERKFDVKAFVARYGGKVYGKKKSKS
ncbi:deoxyribodipyrimidine photo-lyase isoform X2 [Cimex lectularius]|nr:deoxyribodipyrimidine photo-lyase isoform X2 [Cimex lectularius]XP_014256103.1 deoxyribodipyrimidine photo-lyase isoform X2 [Cimex lectularius]XP_024082054.1 deoxyribodipyrimidine photo-lyase isoform X2 [Cimex lectularius]